MSNQDDLQPRYPMNRRTFVNMVAAGAASTLIQGTAAAAQSAPKARNVVLVHGLFADGSSWSEVVARLQAAGAVVYVAARAADVGEDYATLAKTFPTPPETGRSILISNASWPSAWAPKPSK